MRIIRLSNSSSKSQCPPAKNQKISLRKLSQLKILSTPQYYQQKSHGLKNLNQKQSHIKWISDSKQTIQNLKNVCHQTPANQLGLSPKKIPRKKIFQSNKKQTKQNIQMVTFNRIPSVKEVPEGQVKQSFRQSQCISTILSPYKQVHKSKGNNMAREDNAYLSQIRQNQQISRIQKIKISKKNSKTIDNPLLLNPKQQQLPKFAKKLQNKHEDVPIYKKQNQGEFYKNQNLGEFYNMQNQGEFYLMQNQDLDEPQKFTQQINYYRRSQQSYQKQTQIQTKQSKLQTNIQFVKNRQTQQNDQDFIIQYIQQQRINRLHRIQRQNEKLQENLRYIQNQKSLNLFLDSKFQGVCRFLPSDWQIQRQQGKIESEISEQNRFSVSKKLLQITAELQIASDKKIKSDQSFGLKPSKKKVSQFVEQKSLRDFNSPLDFQNQNYTW